MIPGFYYLKLRLFLKRYYPYYTVVFIKGSIGIVNNPLILVELISNNSGKVRLLFEENREEIEKVFTSFLTAESILFRSFRCMLLIIGT